MRALRLAVVAAIASVALLAPSSAHAQIESVTVRDARLGPLGASMTLPVTVSCDPGYTVFGFFGAVVQRRGNRLVRGSGSSFPSETTACTGAPQTFEIAVSNFGDFAFKPGKAQAEVTVGLIGSTFAVETFGPFEVQVHKK